MTPVPVRPSPEDSCAWGRPLNPWPVTPWLKGSTATHLAPSLWSRLQGGGPNRPCQGSPAVSISDTVSGEGRTLLVVRHPEVAPQGCEQEAPVRHPLRSASLTFSERPHCSGGFPRKLEMQGCSGCHSGTCRCDLTWKRVFAEVMTLRWAGGP